MPAVHPGDPAPAAPVIGARTGIVAHPLGFELRRAGHLDDCRASPADDVEDEQISFPIGRLQDRPLPLPQQMPIAEPLLTGPPLRPTPLLAVVDHLQPESGVTAGRAIFGALRPGAQPRTDGGSPFAASSTLRRTSFDHRLVDRFRFLPPLADDSVRLRNLGSREHRPQLGVPSDLLPAQARDGEVARSEQPPLTVHESDLGVQVFPGSKIPTGSEQIEQRIAVQHAGRGCRRRKASEQAKSLRLGCACSLGHLLRYPARDERADDDDLVLGDMDPGVELVPRPLQYGSAGGAVPAPHRPARKSRARKRLVSSC